MLENLPVILVAAVPAILWLLVIASRDRFEPESSRQLLIYFMLGALLVVPVAGVVNTVVGMIVGQVIVVSIIAPISEETGKVGSTWLRGRRDPHLNEIVDGMIYGSAVGLGFAASENVVYVVRAFYDPSSVGDPVLSGLLVTGPVRAISATVMHALASGIGGYFVARHLKAGAPASTALLGLAAAMALHAAFNSVQLIHLFLAVPVLAVGAAAYIVLFRRALAASPFAAADAGALTGPACTSCGQPMPAGAQHCPSCGTPVAAAQPSVVPPAAPVR